jgi:hypothetical protein
MQKFTDLCGTSMTHLRVTQRAVFATASRGGAFGDPRSPDPWVSHHRTDPGRIDRRVHRHGYLERVWRRTSRFGRDGDYRRITCRIEVNDCLSVFLCFGEEFLSRECAGVPSWMTHHDDDQKKRRVPWQDQN